MMASSILSSSFAVASRSQPHPLCRSSCCHCGVADTLWWSLRGRAAAKLWIKSEKGPRESKLLESGFWNWPKNQFVRPSKIFVLDPGGAAPDSGGQENFDGDRRMSGRTRLEIIVRAAANELLKKLNAARKNFPMKIFLLLLGFYTANALATILGQTGDWDVLVAGVVVAAIEGIGMLMYKKPMSDPNGRLKSFVVMVNFWKAGVCLGLFVDAFKLGS